MTEGDLVGQPPQVFQKDEAERYRNRPELPYGQGLDLLIGAQKAGQRGGVEMAVRMGDLGPDQFEHSWITVKRPLGEFRQKLVVAGRQIRTAVAHLRLDPVKIVHQPLGSRDNRFSRRQL